jgi:hypothetical protein
MRFVFTNKTHLILKIPVIIIFLEFMGDNPQNNKSFCQKMIVPTYSYGADSLC